MLVGRLGARVVVVGDDFHFGHRRQGNVALLGGWGPSSASRWSGSTWSAPTASRRREAERVSSTAIRAALAAGDLASANDDARPAPRGAGHGGRAATAGPASSGFPTANVAVPDDICLPADGIYAGWYLRPDGVARPAALSLGRRPTFYEDADTSLLEAHLLDFDGDLYGEPARVRFVRRLRDEQKFDSVDALVAQMGRDCDQAARRARPDLRAGGRGSADGDPLRQPVVATRQALASTTPSVPMKPP